MNWLRLHHEARTDKKLSSLSDAQFRVWFNLLCFSGEQVERGSIGFEDIDVLAVEVAGGDSELLTATIERLSKLKMIEADGGEITFRNFEKRQYDKPSDAPERVTERVRNYRERQRNANVTPGNAIDTDTESETDSEAKTETEIKTFSARTVREPAADASEEPEPAPTQNRSEIYRDFEARFYDPYPRHVGKEPAFKAWNRLKPSDRDAAVAALQRQLEAASFAPDLQFVPHPASWLNAKRWTDDIAAPGQKPTTIGQQKAPREVARDKLAYLESGSESWSISDRQRYRGEAGQKLLDRDLATCRNILAGEAA